jgi:molybdopterin molybdotransferase
MNEHADLVRMQPRETQTVPLVESLGRTLARDIVADRDFPPFARATRDGYAVHSEDLQRVPIELEVVGQIRAGGDFPADFRGLGRGQAFSIMTGAPVPAAANAVVMVEHTERLGNRVRLLRSVAAGENIVPQGSEARAGSVILGKGAVLSYSQIGLAAAVGRTNVQVSARPKVAILSTGDEVVPVEQRPRHNQIRNSNSFSLAAQVIIAGGEPLPLPIAPDEAGPLQELLGQGFQADLLLITGGVSAGEYDLVEEALSTFSAEFLFTGVQMQPGKPLVFGRARSRRSSSDRWVYFFGLPGNPISTMVTFELFARAMVRALAGSEGTLQRGTKARLAKRMHTKTGLTRFLPARLSGGWNDAEVEAVKWQGSGDIAAFSRADCLLVIPPDREVFEAGEWMTVILIG